MTVNVRINGPALIAPNWSNLFRALPFCLAYTYPLLMLLTGQGGWLLLTIPVFTFVCIPVLDIVSGIDLFNPNLEDERELQKNLFFRLITWFWVPLELGVIAYGMWWILQPGKTVLEIAAMILATGITNGVIGITFAHELMHRPTRWEQILAEILMTAVSYPHFCIEHILGHHKNVATTLDPATARFGENFYRFYWRVISTGCWSAWNIEVNRLGKAGLSSWQNRVFRYALTLTIIYAALYATFGWLAICFFALQSLVAFSSLEITNYIEHYGLVRDEVSPGVYERTLPKHSWNSGHRVTNWFLINLGRHSDHHYIASKQYQVLSNISDRAPQFPFGYGTMFLIALVPPLWFRMMNQRVLSWRHNSSLV